MKRNAIIQIGCLLILAGGLNLKAASGTWTGATDATWAGANWTATPVPGTGDTATFNGAGNGNTTIDLGGGVTISNLLFSTGSAAAYTIGAGGAGNQTLTENLSGTISMGPAVAHNELFNAAIVLGLDATAQTYNFVNNSANTLTMATNISGGVAGGTAGYKTLVVGGSGNTVIGGSLLNGAATSVSLTKVGAGTLTFNGNVNASVLGSGPTGGAYGTVTVNGGTLALDFSNFGAVGNADLLNRYSPVSLGGGTINIIGNLSNPTTQNFDLGSGVTVNPGYNVISVSNSATNNLGAFTQTVGSQTMFVGPAYNNNASTDSANLVPATGTITTTTLGNNTALLWPAKRYTAATVGLYEWASVVTSGSGAQTIYAGSQQPAATFYTQIAAGGTFAAADQNCDLLGSATETTTGTMYVDTVRFNVPVAATLSPSGSRSYIGGILVTPNVGTNNTTIAATGHWVSCNASGANAGLDVYQNNPLGQLLFNAPIQNPATYTTSYAQAGAGTVVLTGSGTSSPYTGASYFNGGCTVINNNTQIGASATKATAYLNGGTIVAAATMGLDSSAGVNVRPITLLGNGGGLAAYSNATLTVDGQIGSAVNTGPLVIGIPASAANGNVAGLLPGSGSGTANTTPVYATGTVALTYPNGANGNYQYGGTLITGGATLQINSQYALGGANQGPTTFSGGTLQYSTTLATGTAGTVLDISGQAVKLSGNGSIDVNTHAVTYANAIGNSGSGALTVLDSVGGGGLTLSGGGTYTGTTTVGDGTHSVTLNVNGSLASSGVTANSGATFGVAGTLAGNATWSTGAKTLFTQGTPMTVSGTATLNGNTVTVNVPGAALTDSGSPYTLMTATSIAGGSTVAALPTMTGNGLAPGYNGAVSINGNSVILTVTAAGVVGTWTDGNADQKWSETGNWSGGVPSLAGSSAIFSSAGGSAVTLDANETVGAIILNNPSSDVITGSGTTLTVDDSGFGASATVSAGTNNAINAPVALNENTAIAAGSGTSLTLGGVVSNKSGTRTLAVSGTGTLVLSQANTYGPSAGTVGTTVNGATVQVGNSAALGSGDVSVAGNSTLQAGTAGLNLPNNIAVTSSKTVTVDNNGNNLTLGGTISGGGALTKIGNGTLTLSGNNSFTGNASVNAGVLSVAAAANLVSPNVVLNGGDLLGNGTFVVNNNIGIGATAGTVGTNALMDVANGQTLTVNGVIASAGNTGTNGLLVNSGAGNTGTLILAAANPFKGTTVVSNGVLDLANPLALQNSTLNYSSGTVMFDGSITNATLGGLSGTKNLALTNNLAAAVALILGNNNGAAVYSGNLSGIGTLNMAGNGSQTLGSGAAGGASYSGTTTVDYGSLILGGVGVMNTTNDINLYGTLGSSYLNLVDSAAVTTSGGVYIASQGVGGNDGGNGYPAVSYLTVANNANLNAGVMGFGGAGSSRIPNLSSVTVTNNGTISVSGAFNLNNNAGNTAQTTLVNLNGGTLAVGSFIDTSGAATHQSQINFNGGTLKANADDPSGGYFVPYVAGLTVYVNAAGAFVNPNGHTMSMGPNMVHGNGAPDGGLTVNGSGTFILTGINTYNGNTTVNGGSLAMASYSSLISTNIIVAGGATFDVSAFGGFSLASGQTLSNKTSTAEIAGDFNTGPGTVSLTYASGTPSFDETNGTLTLFSTTTFNVNNTGPALAPASYRLISTNLNGSGAITVADSLPAVTVAGNGVAAGATSALQMTNGQLYLVVTGGVGPSGPGYLTNSISGNTLKLTWPAGQGWRLLGETNSLSVGLTTNGWGVVNGGIDGSNSITVNPALPTVFYRLVYP